MAAALAEAEAYLEQSGLLDQHGAVLYSAEETLDSAEETLAREGPVYLLGLNPGGSESSTLRDSIAASRAGHNAYLDEEWAPGGHVQPKGQATLQRRVQALCAAMGCDTRAVPASNLVFTRSTRTGMHLDYAGALKLCLPVHHIFLKAIRPAFLMTFGSMDYFRQAVTVTQSESRSAEHGTWQAHRGRATVAGQEVAFGNVPHMSLWASDKRPAVIEWVLGART